MSLEGLLSSDLRRAWQQPYSSTSLILPVSFLWKNTLTAVFFLVDTATWIAWYKAGSVGAEWRKKERAHTGQHSVAVRRDIEK